MTESDFCESVGNAVETVRDVMSKATPDQVFKLRGKLNELVDLCKTGAGRRSVVDYSVLYDGNEIVMPVSEGVDIFAKAQSVKNGFSLWCKKHKKPKRNVKCVHDTDDLALVFTSCEA